MMNLKERTAVILKLLCEDKKSFQTAGDLAETLGVSAKTVSRELPDVARTLETFGLALRKKKGSGLTIEGNDAAITSLKELLGQVTDHNYTPQERIHIRESFLAELKTKKEFQTAGRIGAAIAEEFGIQVTEDETGYIAMHLLGARSRYRDKEVPGTVMDNFHLVRLVNHLGPSISRLQMQMDIRNPLLGEMKEKFPELMNLAKICVKDVEKELELIFPESEIAFIAMHLNPDYFAAHEAEFIVSTVPVPQVPLPVVVVSALLSKDDQQQIDEALLHCEERKVEAQASGRTKAALDFPAALRVMGAYNAAIVQLLEGFFFLEDTKSMLVRDVAREIGELTGETAGQAQAIMQALIQREDQGSTAITGCHMILLHCRSAAVTQLQFGIIHVGSWFLYPAEPAEKIRTVIVMLAPLQSSCYELETIGHISAILLERWGLIEVLHEGDKMLIQKELMHIFKTFYAKKYKELLEG